MTLNNSNISASYGAEFENRSPFVVLSSVKMMEFPVFSLNSSYSCIFVEFCLYYNYSAWSFMADRMSAQSRGGLQKLHCSLKFGIGEFELGKIRENVA